MDTILNLCKTHKITIEFDEFGIIIRKFFEYEDKTYCFNQRYYSKPSEPYDIEFYVSAFESSFIKRGIKACIMKGE